jgi:hypothetical protein
MPKGWNLLSRGPELPANTVQYEAEVLRVEGSRRFTYNICPKGSLDSPPYWSQLFAAKSGYRPIFAVYNGDELRWTDDPGCTKAEDLLADEESIHSFVALESYNDRRRVKMDQQQEGDHWYRWAEIYADRDQTVNAGELTGMLSKNVDNAELQLRVSTRYIKDDNQTEGFFEQYNGPLGQLRES